MATPTIASSVARVTATIIGAYGEGFTTTFPPQPTVTRAKAASILDPSHPSPVAFDAAAPLALFIIQAFVIVGFSRILGYFLGKLRQPKVIAEVIAGILIGPSVFGRIPGFTRNIFPPPSIPYLNLVANIGLTLFLFLVGLEVDFSVFARNARASVVISTIGMIIPFGAGAGVAYGIYHEFVDNERVKFGTFMLFVGVANAITAFPVLARILTELQLLQDMVGVTTLAAGVGNDVVGWILLALAIALANADTGVTVVYILLCAIGWVLVLWFIIRPILVFWCRKAGAFGERGPSQIVTTVIIFLALASAWVTEKLGIHAIFGSFLVGLIVPTQIRSALIEKFEDLLGALFLPLYFALSGLNTNLGLLADGTIWGWVFAVIFVAFFSKFISCGAVAKLFGFGWRESGAVGSLMACKGLVELIVLNIGLNAGILNPPVFAMFVVMALVTTFATTPLVLTFYPQWYRDQKRDAALKQSASHNALPGGGSKGASRYAVVLQQFDNLPAVFAFFRLVKAPLSPKATAERPSIDKHGEESASTTSDAPAQDVSVSALRLVELSDRSSALLKASESPETLKAADSLTQIFRNFALGSGIPTQTSFEIVGHDAYSSLAASHAAESRADMLVIPWTAPARIDGGFTASYIPSPLENLIGSGREISSQYAGFVRQVFAEASCDIGLFVDRGLDASAAAYAGRTHLFLAFHGGPDDRAALDNTIKLVLRNPAITATVVRLTAAAEPTTADLATKETTDTQASKESSPAIFSQLTVHGGAQAGTDTIYPGGTDLASDTADDVALGTWFGSSPEQPRTPEVTAALARIQYSSVASAQPLHLSVARARASVQAEGVPLVIIAGRGRRAARSHTHELADFLKTNLEATQSSIAGSSEVRRSLGDLATAYLVSGVANSIFIVQSATTAGGAATVKSRFVRDR